MAWQVSPFQSGITAICDSYNKICGHEVTFVTLAIHLESAVRRSLHISSGFSDTVTKISARIANRLQICCADDEDDSVWRPRCFVVHSIERQNNAVEEDSIA